MSKFYSNYLKDYSDLINQKGIEKSLNDFKEISKNVKKDKAKLIFAGNGASASICSHGAVDFSKQASIRSTTFNEVNLLTCLSNDFGYEKVFSEAIKLYADKNDVLVLVSVSGESKNVINAAKEAKKRKMKIVTFTGKKSSNSLKKLGNVNFWVNSHAYNQVECTHMIWLTAVIDSIIGKAVYKV